MGVAGIRTEMDALAAMRLDREGEEAARLQHAADLGEDLVERRQVDEHVGRQDEVGRPLRLLPQKAEKVALVQPVVEARPARCGEHARRQVDAFNPAVGAGEGLAGEAGAAAEVERALCPQPAPVGREGAPHRRAQELGPTVIQVLDELLVEGAGVIVEQGAHVARADRLLQRHGAEPGEVDADAERVLGIAIERPHQRRQRRLVLSERGPGPAEQRLRRREERRPLQALLGQLGGGAVIAVLQGRLGIGVAAVGEKVAGGAESRAWRHDGDQREPIHAARFLAQPQPVIPGRSQGGKGPETGPDEAARDDMADAAHRFVTNDAAAQE